MYTTQQVCGLVELENFAYDNFTLIQMMKLVFDRLEYIVVKRRKCWFPSFEINFSASERKKYFQHLDEPYNNKLLYSLIFQYF